MSTNALLWMLRLYNTIYTYTSSTIDYGKSVYECVLDAFSTKIYVLFEDIMTPYLVSRVNVAASSSAVPQWYYLPEKNAFVQWELGQPLESLMMNAQEVRSLSVLSMEIHHEESVVYDLTDFLEGVRVYRSSPGIEPSVAHILGAWSTHSGIVLDRKREFIVSMVADSGNTINCDPLSFVGLETMDITPFHEGEEETEEVESEAVDVSGCQGCDKLLNLLATVAADVPKDAGAAGEVQEETTT